MSPEGSVGATPALDPKVRHAVGEAPIQTRSEWPRSTNPDDFPVVTNRDPQWRLSPVASLHALITGTLDGGEYPIDLPTRTGVRARFVGVDEAPRGEVGTPENRLCANAWSQVTSVLQVDIEGPDAGVVHLTREGMGMAARAAHTVVHAHPDSHAILVIHSRGEGLLAENVEIRVDQGASLEFVTVQEWSAESIHYGAHFASVASNASLRHLSVSLGGEVVVLNPSVSLDGAHARGEVYGAYFADHSQHLEHRVFVHHVAPETTSDVTYKGALHGKGARTVWVGDVLIGENAVGTDSYEQNRNLVLSDGTRADSIPNLEIKTGDIKGAGHASATGRFDDNHLFYLQSRGIPEAVARRLVVQGFLLEVVQKISDETTREHVVAQIKRKLDETEEG